MYAYKYFTFVFVYLYFYIETEPSAKLVQRSLLWSPYDYKDKAMSSQGTAWLIWLHVPVISIYNQNNNEENWCHLPTHKL